MNEKCKHEIIWSDKVRVMSFPPVKFGYCKKCNKSCKKVGDTIEWQD